MYPPKATKSPSEWLEWLLTSLGRAGLEFSWDIGLDENDYGVDVKVRLLVPIAKEGWTALKKYITTYSLVCGWSVKQLRQTGRWLTFTAERA